MLRSILVAIHRSPSAGNAMKVAARLARASEAHLKALYIEDPGRFVYVPFLTAATSPLVGSPVQVALLPPNELIAESERQEEEERALQLEFEEICRKEGLRGQFQIVRGSIEELLVERAVTVDLLVMGHNPEWTMSGSLLERTLRKTVRPVLAVGRPMSQGGAIIFAYDGSLPSQRALAAGATLVGLGLFNEVHLVTAAESPEEARGIQAQAREFLSHHTDGIQTAVCVGDAREAILKEAAECDAGLIVMGGFGSMQLTELLFGSTTRDMLAEAPCPLLLAS